MAMRSTDFISTRSFTIRVCVDTAYKRKAQKVQPVNSSISNGSKPDDSNDWKVNAIKNEIPILDPHSMAHSQIHSYCQRS